jgi:hypothetical protein
MIGTKHDKSDTPRTDAELLRLFMREHAPGGCKILSIGSRCDCPLRRVDRLERALAAAPDQPAELATIGDDFAACPKCNGIGIIVENANHALCYVCYGSGLK